MQVQSLLIPVAAIATFAGVYAIAPSGQSTGSAVEPPPAATASAAPAKGPRAANPLAPAEKGLVECSRPDDARKTCRTMAEYTPLGGSQYRVTAVMLVSETGPVTLETKSTVEVGSGSVCGTLTRNELAGGRLRVAGRLVRQADAAPILAAFQRSLRGVMNKEICSTYVASNGGLTEVSTINGVHLPGLRQPVKWIRLDAGYTIGS